MIDGRHHYSYGSRGTIQIAVIDFEGEIITTAKSILGSVGYRRAWNLGQGASCRCSNDFIGQTGVIIIYISTN